MVFLAFAAAAAFVTLRRAAVFCFAVDMYSPVQSPSIFFRRTLSCAIGRLLITMSASVDTQLLFGAVVRFPSDDAIAAAPSDGTSDSLNACSPGGANGHP